MKSTEEKSIRDGNLIVLNEFGKPLNNVICIWFVWYRSEDSNNYKILLKTFNSDKYHAISSLNSIRTKFNNSGLGFLNLLTGKCNLLKPESDMVSM